MNNWIYGAEIIKKYANGLGRGRDTPSDRKDNQITYMSEVPITFTTLSAIANIGDSSITVVDGSHFIQYDLMSIMGTIQEFRRISTIATNVLGAMTNIENAHIIGDGVSNVSEFGRLTLVDTSGAQKIYARIEFATAKTVTLGLDLLVKG